MIEDLLTGDELLQDFWSDMDGLLQGLERDLVILQSRGDDAEILRRILQTLHTMRSTSELLGLGQLARLIQATEALLHAGRPNEAGRAAPLPAGVFEAVARIKALAYRIRTAPSEWAADAPVPSNHR